MRMFELRQENGITIIEAVIVTPIILIMVLFVAGFSVYSYKLSIANRDMLLVMEKAEGNEKLWVKDPYSQDKGTYLIGMQELQAQAKNIIGTRGFKKVINYPYVKGTASTFAFLPPGFCAYFMESDELYCNDTFICAEKSEMADLMSASGKDFFTFCNLHTGKDVPVSLSHLQEALNNVNLVQGSCAKYPSCDLPKDAVLPDASNIICPTPKPVECKNRGATPHLKIVNDYATEVVAEFDTHIPFSSIRTLKLKKLGGPKTVTALGCTYNFKWEYTPWGMCQGTPICANSTGSQSRQAQCIRNGCNQPNLQVDSIFCDPAQREPLTKSCNIPALPPGQWQQGEWTPCSASCGVGTQTRSYYCVRSSAGCGCTPPAPPSQTQSCNNGPCPAYQCVFGSTCPDGSTNYRCVDTAGNPAPGKCFGVPHENPADPGTCTHCPVVTSQCDLYAVGWVWMSGADDHPDLYQAACNAGHCPDETLKTLIPTFTNQARGTSSGAACFENYLKPWIDPQGMHGNNDNRVSWYNGVGYKSSLQPQSLASFIGDPSAGNYQPVPDTTSSRSLAWNMTYIGYYDNNCKWVPPNQAQNRTLCGAELFSVTPISLIWDDGYDIEQNKKLVEFNLNPRQKEIHWSEWKASDKAPLLVFDPKHTLNVTSAESLFGSYTFGGKARDSDKARVSPWTNGFEALESLDKNGDNEISGIELDDIALWFDGNQNGISEKGEVRPARDEGIVALYFDNPNVGQDHKSFYLDIGFKRTINRKTVTGKAIDWDGYVFASKQDAINASLGNSHLQNNLTNNSLNTENKSPVTIEEVRDDNQQKLGPNLTGIWVWHVTEKDAQPFPGFFEIHDYGENIIGWSASEVPLKDKEKKLRSAVIYSPLTGKKIIHPNSNKVMVQITLRNKEQNVEVKNEVEIFQNGEQLSGKAEQAISNTTNGKPLVIPYQWSATKLKNVTLTKR